MDTPHPEITALCYLVMILFGIAFIWAIVRRIESNHKAIRKQNQEMIEALRKSNNHQ